MQENDHEMEYANITEEVNSNRPDEITGFIIEDVSVVSEEDPLAGTSPGTEDLPIPEQEPVVAVAEPVFQQPGFLSYLETTAGCCLATWLAILIVGGVVATAALCAQGFCNSSDKDPFTVTTNETTAVPGPPEFNRTTAIMDILPNFTLRSIQNISSPQHFAFQWLYDHPLLETLDDPRKQQLYALATLYYCLNGDDWSLYYFEQDDFLSYSVHECDWDGLFNNDSLACNLQREISEIDFSYAEMNGTIPSEISMLSELNTLILSDNCISGPIPTQVANLSRLRTLDISNNRVTGFLPTEVAVMTSLLRLDLSNNHFVGPFPLVLTSITELEILKLSNNDISGQMPSELGLMSSLRHLWMSGNHLVGKLPDALSMLSGLEELSIAKNQLTGPIHALGKLTTNLKQVDLSANLLSGSLPTELGLLTGLQFLHLFDNTLSGTLPTELGLLQNLTELCLNNNTLVGSVSCLFYDVM